MRKKFLLRLRAAVAVWIVCAALRVPALAAGSLIPVGEAVGIQMTLEGVLVVDISEVETAGGPVCPAGDAGLRTGDVILAVNGREMTCAADLTEAAEEAAPGPLTLTVERNGKRQDVSVVPAADKEGTPKLGLWLRDGVAGIGTVTYVDPETGAFGALGHGVNDTRTGTLLPLEEGNVCKARIVDIVKGGTGSPGELAGSFYAGDVLGRIEKNTDHGIFGTFQCGLKGLAAPVAVAEPSEVVAGPATIRACISGRTVREYDVEISRTGVGAGEGRDLMIHVTDPALLAATGGIVQGMSGSPILQNGKLVGAVTHVLVSDATRGYGIFIQNMLDAAA